MIGHVPFYNPRHLSGEVLEKMMVGRQPLLDEIMSDLRKQAESGARQHWLLRGPRGIGKTHMSGMIYHRVRRQEDLARSYLPVWLAEADAYEVYSAGTLMVKVAEQLVEELRAARDPAEGKLRAAVAALSNDGDSEALFMECTALLGEEAARRGQVFLVLMENLDAMLDSFAPKQRGVETKRFRSLLLHDRSFLFVSTTPTRYLPLSDPTEPLYGHLKERVLASLSEEDTRVLFRSLGEITSRADLAKRLTEGDGSATYRRVLHRLTGGLPRSVVMGFEVMSEGGDIREDTVQGTVESMQRLLEMQTAYFEARLSRLAPRERAIVTAMALAERDLTLQEIAKRSRLPERSISTHVRRLVDEGHVEMVYGDGGKGTIYGISDGLFRTWYQFRKGRPLLRPLVHFIAFWCAPEELQGARQRLLGLLPELETSPLSGELARRALLQLEEACRISESPEGQRKRAQLWRKDLKSLGLITFRILGGSIDRALTAMQDAYPERVAALRGRLVNGLDAQAVGQLAAEMVRSEISIERDLLAPLLGALSIDLSSFEEEERIQILQTSLKALQERPEKEWQLAAGAIHERLVRLFMKRHEFDSVDFHATRAVNLLGQEVNHDAQTLVVFSLLYAGIALSANNQRTKGIGQIKELLHRFQKTTDPMRWDAVCWARIALASFQFSLGLMEEGEANILEGLAGLPSASDQAKQIIAGYFSSFFPEVSSMKVRGWLNQIAVQNPEPETIEIVRLISNVLDVLDAADEAPQGDHYRKALALIPAELRATVEEKVKEIILGTLKNLRIQ